MAIDLELQNKLTSFTDEFLHTIEHVNHVLGTMRDICSSSPFIPAGLKNPGATVIFNEMTRVVKVLTDCHNAFGFYHPLAFSRIVSSDESVREENAAAASEVNASNTVKLDKVSELTCTDDRDAVSADLLSKLPVALAVKYNDVWNRRKRKVEVVDLVDETVPHATVFRTFDEYLRFVALADDPPSKGE
jgi:hypothetical protein